MTYTSLVSAPVIDTPHCPQLVGTSADGFLLQFVRQTQVSAHGTGARIPTVDEQVVGMRLVTPGRGTLELSEASDPELFRLARVGLGLLGVVSQVTLQCYPTHTLLEHTFVAPLKVSTSAAVVRDLPCSCLQTFVWAALQARVSFQAVYTVFGWLGTFPHPIPGFCGLVINLITLA